MGCGASKHGAPNASDPLRAEPGAGQQSNLSPSTSAAVKHQPTAKGTDAAKASTGAGASTATKQQAGTKASGATTTGTTNTSSPLFPIPQDPSTGVTNTPIPILFNQYYTNFYNDSATQASNISWTYDSSSNNFDPRVSAQTTNAWYTKIAVPGAQTVTFAIGVAASDALNLPVQSECINPMMFPAMYNYQGLAATMSSVWINGVLTPLNYSCTVNNAQSYFQPTYTIDTTQYAQATMYNGEELTIAVVSSDGQQGCGYKLCVAVLSINGVPANQAVSLPSCLPVFNTTTLMMPGAYCFLEFSPNLMLLTGLANPQGAAYQIMTVNGFTTIDAMKAKMLEGKGVDWHSALCGACQAFLPPTSSAVSQGLATASPTPGLLNVSPSPGINFLGTCPTSLGSNLYVLNPVQYASPASGYQPDVAGSMSAVATNCTPPAITGGVGSVWGDVSHWVDDAVHAVEGAASAVEKELKGFGQCVKGAIETGVQGLSKLTSKTLNELTGLTKVANLVDGYVMTFALEGTSEVLEVVLECVGDVVNFAQWIFTQIETEWNKILAMFMVLFDWGSYQASANFLENNYRQLYSDVLVVPNLASSMTGAVVNVLGSLVPGDSGSSQVWQQYPGSTLTTGGGGTTYTNPAQLLHYVMGPMKWVSDRIHHYIGNAPLITEGSIPDPSFSAAATAFQNAMLALLSNPTTLLSGTAISTLQALEQAVQSQNVNQIMSIIQNTGSTSLAQLFQGEKALLEALQQLTQAASELAVDMMQMAGNVTLDLNLLSFMGGFGKALTEMANLCGISLSINLGNMTQVCAWMMSFPLTIAIKTFSPDAWYIITTYQNGLNLVANIPPTTFSAWATYLETVDILSPKNPGIANPFVPTPTPTGTVTEKKILLGGELGATSWESDIQDNFLTYIVPKIAWFSRIAIIGWQTVGLAKPPKAPKLDWKFLGTTTLKAFGSFMPNLMLAIANCDVGRFLDAGGWCIKLAINVVAGSYAGGTTPAWASSPVPWLRPVKCVTNLVDILAKVSRIVVDSTLAADYPSDPVGKNPITTLEGVGLSGEMVVDICNSLNFVEPTDPDGLVAQYIVFGAGAGMEMTPVSAAAFSNDGWNQW